MKCSRSRDINAVQLLQPKPIFKTVGVLTNFVETVFGQLKKTVFITPAM